VSRIPRLLWFVAAAGVLAVVALGSPSPARADGALAFDAGVEWLRPGPLPDDAPLPLGLDIPFLSDCGPQELPPGCGDPPALWAPARRPVEFCSRQAGRPAWLSAERFRAVLAEAAATWGAAEAGIGLRYAGDCPDGDRWRSRNALNEVGFDDERRVVAAGTAAVTRAGTSWSPAEAPTQRALVEADVVLDGALTHSPACLRAVLVHELGHVVGFGHSTDSGDVMFGSFDPLDAASCHGAPSARELAQLQRMYGVDRAPTVRIVADETAEPGGTVTLRAEGVDPEGGELQYRWEQREGPPVDTAGAGAQLSFVAASAGARYVFRVTVADRMLHRAEAPGRVRVMGEPVAATTPPGPGAESSRAASAGNSGPPTGTLAFGSFLAAPGGGVRIGWEGVWGATRFEVCSVAADGSEPGCTTSANGTLGVDWTEVVTLPADLPIGVELRSGARATRVRACNEFACTAPAAGPVAGAVRWLERDLDYAYFAMAYDVGGLQFTIIGAVNLGNAARGFVLAASDGAGVAREAARCGWVPRGGLCIGLVTPSDGPQGATASITVLLGDGPPVSSVVLVR
jgi:hypothetical protein